MFIYGNPVPPDEFVGRRRELQRIASRIAHHGQSSAIVGEHRTGKTSLLDYLASAAGKEYVQALTASELSFVHLDAHAFPSELSSAEFWRLALGSALAPTGTATDLRLSELDNGAVEAWLMRVKLAGRRIVVIIDEFDALVHSGTADPTRFFGGLRSLTTRSGGALALVLASRSSMRDLDERAQSYGYTGSPYFNFVSEVTLGPLADHEVEAILGRAGTFFTHVDCQWLHALSGGFPYLVQAAAAALWAAYQEHSGMETRRIEAYRGLRKETDRTLWDIWRAWPSGIRHVFAAVALEHLHSLSCASPNPPGFLDRALVDSEVFAPELEQLQEQGYIRDDSATLSGKCIRPLIFLTWFSASFRAAAASEAAWEDWLRKQGIGGPLQSRRSGWLLGARQVLSRVLPTFYWDDVHKGWASLAVSVSAAPPESSPPEGEAPGAPIVFVSYSYDSEAHRQWVRKLAEHLCQKGVDVILDQWDARLGEDLGAFMEQSIRRAQRVLLICSTNYVARANAGLGGVGYEKLIVTKEVVQNTATRKFIPLIRGNMEKTTPDFIGARFFIDFDDEESFGAKLDELVDEFYDRRARPKVGRDVARRE